jgi:CheY-like chemotaxis protein
MRSNRPANGERIYPRLLVVDDNPLNQRLAKRVLVKMNYCVDVVSDGKQAVAAAMDRDYLAILMDCQLPVMDGFDAARAIRCLPGPRGRTSIIAMTAFDTNENRQACLDAGMNAFSPKPVDWSSVESLLQDTAMSGSATVEFRDLDLSLKQAWREHVVLNPKVLAQAIGDGGGPDVIAELVWLFRTESNELFDRLGLALASGNAALSHLVCTELRGTVSSIGAERLADLMSNIGDLAQGGYIEEATRAADRVWDELALVLDELEARVVRERQTELADAIAEGERAGHTAGGVRISPWPAPSGHPV